MAYFYLIFAVFLNSTSSIFGKFFFRKNDQRTDGAIFYNFWLILSVFAGWGVLYAFDFSFDPAVLIYSLLFAVFYIMGIAGLTGALQHGPAVLSTLLLGLSLLVPTVWGFFFWSSPVTFWVILGLILVAVAIVLCLWSGEKDEKSVSVKWLIYITFAFFGNAGCTVVQRTQQRNYDGQHGIMLMFFAVGFAALAFLVVYLHSDRRDTPAMLKTSWWGPVCAGICNLLLNGCIMLLAVSSLSPSLIYPVLGVSGLGIVTVFSLFVFRERMRWWQWVGIAVGTVAVALLSV